MWFGEGLGSSCEVDAISRDAGFETDSWLFSFISVDHFCADFMLPVLSDVD